MNKAKEKERGLTKGQRSLFVVVVTFMVMGVFLLASCDNNGTVVDLTEAITEENSLSKAVVAENTRRGEGRDISHRTGDRSFLREDFIRWAEERGYSREDLSQRHIWREYRLAKGETFKDAERHHHRFDKGNKGETRFERRGRPEKG